MESAISNLLVNLQGGIEELARIVGKVEAGESLRPGFKGKRGCKRTREDSQSQSACPSKRIRAVPGEDMDFFSRLPDDIIIFVLSRLDTIEQRVATSMLARRWRHLWKKSSCADLTFNSGRRKRGLLSWKKDGLFIRKVNRIIKSLCRSDCNTMRIDQLNIVFNMIDDNDKIFQSDIDRWLRFAFQKKVERLNLDCGGLGFNCYSLIDSQVFRTSSNIGMLRSLSLRNVKVSGELLEYILTVTPNLEELCVKSAGPSLVSFTVAGPSLKLKHLQLLVALTVKRLHINNVNLESLHYDGDPESLIIEKTPSLVKVHTYIFIDFNRFSNFPRMLSKLPELETLALSTIFANKSFYRFPKLRNLKRLELDLGSDARCRSLCASLLDACPVLNELKIKLLPNNESREEERVTALSNPHKGLKVIEVNGFSGCENDVGVVDYLIDNTALIQKMIVDTRVSTGFCSKLNYPKEHEAIRALAKAHLENRLSAETTTILII